ncbi:MAG: IS3 family transposase, partial [Gammaproteobacteria bacterium]|nr:IS3 family transposase [Gammaproteobacteria bacterium]NIQ08673.1 IS3 family transposase [Gammaproteobacteria bacterium]NIQ74519.1 IS3 family transposase [Gammaproteobacteria bacterium]NIY18880.1 IS3 family transposase [Gammaproteobacteria bacterium]
MMSNKRSVEKTVRDIRRATRKKYSPEEKIRIVLEGLRGEDSIAELCRREGINSNVYYRWSKDFMEAGKKRLAGDIIREATSDEVKQLRAEAAALKEALAEQVMENRLLKKKRDRGWGGRYMRYTAAEKYEIIRAVEESSLPVRQTLRRLDIGKSAFYNWLKRYQDDGIDGLEDKKPSVLAAWNRIPEDHRDAVIELALDRTALSPREIAVTYTDQEGYFVSESTVYRILKAKDLITSPAYILMQASDQFQHPSRRVNELWQTDFTYFKIMGWGWYYLSTVLDDYSRYIVAWRLCSSMSATDVQDTLDDALAFTGLDQVKVNHKPRLLSDNGPCYLSGELSSYLEQQGMTHTRGKPYHPQTQGKIERWHRSMKNQILLNHYYLPSELEEHLQRFITYYNHERYHESLNNLTPADVFYGHDQEILEHREQIKLNTMIQRRK